MRKLFMLGVFVGASSAFGNTAIETETAQIGKQGEFGFSQSIEFEKATDARALQTLTQLEYAITDRSEILVEPFFQLWEFPNGGPSAHGVGDLEITPSYMIVTEDGSVPAILLATKVKVPTGSDQVGGTGKFDYYPYLIFGQHLGSWTFNANIGVNFAKPADGGPVDKYLMWAVEAEREVAPKLTMFFELYSTEDETVTVSTAAQYQLGEHFNSFLALSYKADHSIVVRPGVNLEF